MVWNQLFLKKDAILAVGWHQLSTFLFAKLRYTFICPIPFTGSPVFASLLCQQQLISWKWVQQLLILDAQKWTMLAAKIRFLKKKKSFFPEQIIFEKYFCNYHGSLGAIVKLVSFILQVKFVLSNPNCWDTNFYIALCVNKN